MGAGGISLGLFPGDSPPFRVKCKLIMSEENEEVDSQIGVTKYQLFIKGLRGQTIVIIVHKVNPVCGLISWHGFLLWIDQVS